MVDLDITKNNLGDATLTIPGDPNTAEFPAEDWAESQSIQTMSAVVVADAAYTEADVLRMTKNDLLMAFRQVTGNADH